MRKKNTHTKKKDRMWLVGIMEEYLTIVGCVGEGD